MAIAEIHITLKPSLFDAQGQTVLKALRNLGHSSVTDVRIGKFITVEVPDGSNPAVLTEELDKMCQELLANPVIEDYEIAIAESPAAGVS